jgi:hypothetical protein
MFEALGGTTLLDRPPVVEMARGFRSGMTDELIWLGTFLLRTLGEAEKIMQEQREGMGL